MAGLRFVGLNGRVMGSTQRRLRPSSTSVARNSETVCRGIANADGGWLKSALLVESIKVRVTPARRVHHLVLPLSMNRPFRNVRLLSEDCSGKLSPVIARFSELAENCTKPWLNS